MRPTSSAVPPALNHQWYDQCYSASFFSVGVGFGMFYGVQLLHDGIADVTTHGDESKHVGNDANHDTKQKIVNVLVVGAVTVSTHLDDLSDGFNEEHVNEELVKDNVVADLLGSLGFTQRASGHQHRNHHNLSFHF